MHLFLSGASFALLGHFFDCLEDWLQAAEGFIFVLKRLQLRKGVSHHYFCHIRSLNHHVNRVVFVADIDERPYRSRLRFAAFWRNDDLPDNLLRLSLAVFLCRYRIIPLKTRVGR